MKVKIEDNVYNINKDIEQLKKLRSEIIEDCSEITHVNYDNICFIPGRYNESSEYRNIEVEEIEIENKLPGEERYNIEADYYKYPYLVKIIDRLLRGTIRKEDFKFLYDPNNLKELFTIEKQLSNVEEIYDDIMNLDEDNTNIKDILLDKIMILLQKEELNENQVDPLTYYELVRDCITFEKTEKEGKVNFEITKDNHIKEYIMR